MLDITPATALLTDIVTGVRDDQLSSRTPCSESTVGDLLDHVDSFATAFARAAEKLPVPGSGTADASRLGADWRLTIPDKLADLAKAWSDPQAWTGMTQAGGLNLPGEIAGLIALNETLVHGWDIAMATGQEFDPDVALVEAAYGFVAGVVSENPDGAPGLFGPPVAVPDDARALDRLLGGTGRNSSWRP